MSEKKASEPVLKTDLIACNCISVTYFAQARLDTIESSEQNHHRLRYTDCDTHMRLEIFIKVVLD